MADNNYGYLFGMPGATDPNKTDDASSPNNPLFKALLAQTMQQGGGTGMGGIIAKMLGTAASAYGQPGMLGGSGLTVDTGQAGGSLGQMSVPDSMWGA